MRKNSRCNSHELKQMLVNTWPAWSCSPNTPLRKFGLLMISQKLLGKESNPIVCLKGGEGTSAKHGGVGFFFPFMTFIYFFLKYSWFAMLYWFLVYSKVVQLYIYIKLFFFMFFSIIVYYKILNIVPCTI